MIYQQSASILRNLGKLRTSTHKLFSNAVKCLWMLSLQCWDNVTFYIHFSIYSIWDSLFLFCGQCSPPPTPGEEINDCHYLKSLQVPGNLILCNGWDGLKSRAPKMVKRTLGEQRLGTGGEDFFPFVQEKRTEGQLKMHVRKIPLRLLSLRMVRWRHLSVCCVTWSARVSVYEHRCTCWVCVLLSVHSCERAHVGVCGYLCTYESAHASVKWLATALPMETFWWPACSRWGSVDGAQGSLSSPSPVAIPSIGGRAWRDSEELELSRRRPGHAPFHGSPQSESTSYACPCWGQIGHSDPVTTTVPSLWNKLLRKWEKIFKYEFLYLFFLLCKCTINSSCNSRRFSYKC